MHVIVSRPFDDDEIVEVYLVEHKSVPQLRATNQASHCTAEQFQKDWEKALAQAKKDRPETWCVDEVITDLEGQGWQILHADTSTVTY